MADSERPEKRRKLDGNIEDGQTSRSPRVVINKLSVDNALLERFRQIKNLTRQKAKSKLEKKESRKNDKEIGKEDNDVEVSKDTEDSHDSTSLRNKLLDSESGTDHPTSEGRQEDITIFLSNKFKDETVEVLDSSEKWMQSDRSSKRKRDENCNEGVSVDKVAKLLEADNLVPIDETQKAGQFSLDANEGTLPQSTKSNEVKEKRTSLVEQIDDVLADSSNINNLQENVEVAKVAQDYAKSGAQTEKIKDDDAEKIERSNVHGDKTDPETTDESDDYTEEALVYQLLKDVIEKQTTLYANNLMRENEKLGKRVEHLEKENALLQKTSKRLHLALQAVFKNREKTRKSGTSRGVQVNMNLHRLSFRHTPPVNISILDEAEPKDETVVPNGDKPSQSCQSGHVDKPVSNAGSNDVSKSRNTENKDCPLIYKVSMKTIGIQTQELATPKYFTQGMGHFKLHSCPKQRGQNPVLDSGETSHFKMTPRGLELKAKSRVNTENREEELPTASAEAESNQNKDRSSSVGGTFVNTPVDPNLEPTAVDTAASQISSDAKRKIQTAKANTDASVVSNSAQQKSTSSVTAKERPRSHFLTSLRSQEIPLSKSPSVSEEASSPLASHRPQNICLNVSSAGEDESLKFQSNTATKEPENGPNYREPRSPVIPKNSISHCIKAGAQPQKNNEEADLIIVTPIESSIGRDEIQNVRRNNAPSLRTYQSEIRSTRKEGELLERQRYVCKSPTPRTQERSVAENMATRMVPNTREQQTYAQSGRIDIEGSVSRSTPNTQILSGRNMTEVSVSKTVTNTQQEQNQILPGRSLPENTVSRAVPNTINEHTPKPQELRKSAVPHLGQIPSKQTLHYTNTSNRGQERPSQLSIRQDAYRSPRYASSEMRAVSENERRDSVQGYRGSHHPPHLIPSQPQRAQEQFRSQQSASFETANSQRQEGHPISAISEIQNGARFQRISSAAQQMRSQPAQPAPTHISKQQHLIVRQQHPQQMARQPPRVGNPQVYTQQYPRASHPNAVRSQAPVPFQSTHHMQHAPRSMVGRGRIRPSMPLSPEYGRTSIQRGPYNEPTTSQPPQLIPGNVQPARQGPVVVYQPGALEGAVRQPNPTTQAHFESFPEHIRQGHIPSQVGPQRVASTTEQFSPRNQTQMAQRPPPPYEMHRVEDRRARDVQERQQTHVSPASTQRSPPKPSASIAVVENGIVLSWNVSPDQDTSDIDSYELFACQDDSSSSCPPVLWKKIGVVKALPLPMACTLTQFSTGSRYQFAVRAVDTSERAGPFSDPCVITLKKS